MLSEEVKSMSVIAGARSDPAVLRRAIAAGFVGTAMGIATLLIGLLPGYQSIGAAAQTLLIILRLLQGFSLGGEFGGVATLLIEHAPKDRRGAVGGWAQAGGFVGPLLGTGVILILRATLSDPSWSA